MIDKALKWFLAPSTKPSMENYTDIYTKLLELEARVEELERENVGTTNELYRLENSLESRIDILIEHLRIDYDV